MLEPGGLDMLGERGRTAWADRVARALVAAGASPFVAAAPDARTPATTVIDWPGAPLRPIRCLSRRTAHELLDREGARRRLHEEYVEWRVVRDARDRIRRVEMTTELSAYWRTLAAYAPRRLLGTMARFARERSVAPEAAYGDLDPYAPDVGPDEREAAFAAAMLDEGAASPYATGERALCCMVQPSNTLGALARLAVAAAVGREVTDPVSGRGRCPTAAEAIPLFPQAARRERASDPVIAERIGRLAWERRLIAFDDPVGVYLAGVEHTRLRRPDGRPVPAAWFTFGRGTPPRAQRLTLEVPHGEGCVVGDLVDAATGERLRFGAQVAELAQVTLRLRVSEPGLVAGPRRERVEPAAAAAGGADDCRDVRRAQRELGGAR